MDVNKILSADILDIIFEGRNKQYGAYELRKTYNNRLRNALLATAALCLILFLGSLLANSLGSDKDKKLNVNDVQLEEVKQEEKKNEPPPPPPPPKVEPPKVEMAKFTPPKIVKDEEVKEDEKPPEVEKLEDTKIGTANQEGVKDDGIVAPPVEDKGGVVEAPKEDEDKVFTKVEVEAAFPGGDGAWKKFIEREISKNIDELQEAGQAGTCLVQFVVDKEGNVSDVEALTMKGTKLAEVCVNAIKRGPKWTPAVQNGRNVKAYRKQPVSFVIEEQ